jgi:hypothetical protein
MSIHILMSCGINTIETPTIIFEDNTACAAQIQTGYVKSNLTKYISPKFFYRHELLQQQGEVRVLQVKSNDNLTDLLMKQELIAVFAQGRVLCKSVLL